MRINNKQANTLRQHDEPENIEEVDKFVSVVSKDGATDEDIRCRINKARYAYNTLKPIWRSTALSVRNKIRIFNTNVKSVLLYGSETWRATKTSTTKLQSFINRCLRNILNLRIWTSETTSAFSPKSNRAHKRSYIVAAKARKTGLQINIGKTEAVRINNRQADPLRLHWETFKEVDKFVYFGGVVSKDGATDEDIRCRINKARHAFNTQYHLEVYSPVGFERRSGSSRYQPEVGLTLWLRNITSTLINCKDSPTDASETSSTLGGLKLSQSQTKICGTEQRKQSSRQIEKRKWGWIGQTLRKSVSNINGSS
ncbi:hypothetical protein EGW08_000319 [Elysia chlorotica]|uniref:DUF6451 domain-containing protein n=1 Tax=Elysia chlorotica TaxID=188477 RepID=A0A433UDF9_ELYCH|nr:hypothetical protein EGW08_000319 [Elysia chlorotica]